jgi:hypothetical protein
MASLQAGRPDFVVLLANVGNRDLVHKRDDKWYPASAREEFAHNPIGTAAHDDLRVPIIAAYIDEYLQTFRRVRMLRNRAPTIDKVVLFGTNQPSSHPQDTIEGAGVIKRWLAERYGAAIKTIEVVAVTTEQPNRHDRMFEWYQKWIRTWRMDNQKTPTHPHVGIALAGGTPAQNMALLFVAVNTWGDAVEPVTTVEPPQPVRERRTPQPMHLDDGERQEVIRLEVGEYVREQTLRAPVAGLLRGAHFDAAAERMATWRDPSIAALATSARAMARWLDSDPEGARDLLRELIAERRRRGIDDGTGKAISDLDRELQKRIPDRNVGARAIVPPPHRAIQLIDLYWAARTCFEHGRLTDAVGRAAGLVEATIRWVLERELGLTTDARKPNDTQALRRVVEEQGLVPPIWGKETDRHGELSVYTFIEIGQKVCETRITAATTDDEKEPLKALQSAIKAIDGVKNLREIRNRSVIGHDFEPVSAVAIETGSLKDRDGEELATLDACLNAMISALRGLKVGDARESPFLRFGDRLACEFERVAQAGAP